MKEKIKERGRTFKVFQVDKKHKRFEIRCKPIHYKDSENQWQDIDVSLNPINNPTKNRTDFLALKNTFTLGFRGDKTSEKFSGIRYKGSSDYQYEITPISIQLDSDVITVPKTFKKVLLLDKYNIEHLVVDDISLCTKVNEVCTQSLVKTDRHISSFRIIEQLDLTGFKIINPYKNTKTGKRYLPTTENEFIFATDEFITEKIIIPQPKMWSKEKNEIKDFSEDIKHSLCEKDGILYYEKFSTPKGNKWLKNQVGTLFLDETSYYANTSDGYSYSYESTWNTARTTSDINTKSYTVTNRASAMEAYVVSNYAFSRTWFWFDTSAIADDATITDVVLNIYGYAYNNTDVCAMLSTQNETFANWTNNAFSGSEYGHVTWTINQYNQITFNTTGKGNINKTGNTKVCLREYTHDYLDSEPGSNQSNGCYFADETGTSKDPYITVTVGIQELYDTVTDIIINNPLTDMEFILTSSISGTHTPTLEGLSFGTTKSLTESSNFLTPSLSYGVTKELISSNTPSIIKDLSYTLAPSIIELSNLSIPSKFILESAVSGTYILTAADLLTFLAVISTSSTSTPTLSKVLIYHLISSFQSSSTFSSFTKFILEKAATSSHTPTVIDIYTLIDLVSTTTNNTPGVFCKFKLVVSDTGSGTPSVSSILGKFDIVSFEIQGTSSISKVMDYSPIITVEISEQFFIDAFQTLIKNVTFTTTGVPTASKKDLLEVLFTEISILSSLVKFSLEQSLIQTNTATVDKIISFIKDIEMSSTSSLSIEDILEFILTIPLSTSKNIIVEDIQTLIGLISFSTQENLSTSIKNILSILFQETSIFSSILKFFIVKTITNNILSTINIAVSYRDTMLLTIENVSLVTLLEELAKLVLTLSDTQLKDLTLEDSQIINLTLSDTQLKDLTLEDS